MTLGSPVGISRSFAWVVGAPCQYQKHFTNDESGGSGTHLLDTISTTVFYRFERFISCGSVLLVLKGLFRLSKTLETPVEGGLCAFPKARFPAAPPVLVS
jgi:hypothetical protein